MKHKTSMFETFGKNAGICLSAAWPDFGLCYIFIFTIVRSPVSFDFFQSDNEGRCKWGGIILKLMFLLFVILEFITIFVKGESEIYSGSKSLKLVLCRP